MNTTVLHVFNFKWLMFQIEHRQGVEPVFAFNICCIALNTFLCSSLEHVLAFKMCSMKNICVQSAAHWKCSILQNTFKVFNICCIVGVQIAVLYLNTCSWTHANVQYLVINKCSSWWKPFSTWCSNSALSPLTLMVFNITEHVQGVQYLLRFWRSDGVLNLNTHVYSVLFDLFCSFRENTHEQQLIQAKIFYQCPSRNILDFVYGGSHFSTGVHFSTCRTRKKSTPVTFFLHMRHVFLRPGSHFSTTKNDP